MHHNYQVIVNTFAGNGPLCLSFSPGADSTVYDVKSRMAAKMNLAVDDQVISTVGGRSLADGDAIFSDPCGPIVFNLSLRLRGGKGGFGSMLRAQGGRMNAQKATNIEACRDLQGRRIRHVNEAKKLQEELEAIPKREKEKRERLQKKIEKALKEYEPTKHRFDDNEFLEESEKMVKGVKDAVGSLFKRQKIEHKPAPSSSAATASMFDDDEDEDEDEDEDDGEGEDDDDEDAVDVNRDTPQSSSAKGKGKAKSSAIEPAEDEEIEKSDKTVLSEFFSTDYEEYDSEDDGDFEANEDESEEEEDEDEDEDLEEEESKESEPPKEASSSSGASSSKKGPAQGRKRKDRED